MIGLIYQYIFYKIVDIETAKLIELFLLFSFLSLNKMN